LDSILWPYHIHTYHFLENKNGPHPPLFGSLVLMAHTHNQDFKTRFNILQSSLIETQQEVKQLSANVVTINTTMQSSMEEIKQDLAT
jgi:hypothetical protein